MVSTRSMMVRTKARRSAIVVALPHNVLVDIMGHVAASSQPMADLYSLRTMYKASKALERGETMKWLDNEHYLAVVNYLAGAGNSEACFTVGLPLIFAHHDKQRGLDNLKRAAVAGHKIAAYMLGLLLYTANESSDVGKHYISQVEGELVGGGCETVKRTNQECKWCQRLAADAVQAATWKKKAGSQGRVLVLPKDGHRCTSTRCGMNVGWDDYVVFCSDGCRIRHEYAKFFAKV